MSDEGPVATDPVTPIDNGAVKGDTRWSAPVGGRPSRRFLLVVLAAILLGLGIRVANVMIWRPSELPSSEVRRGVPDDPDALVLGGDALYYHAQAEALAAGEGFVDGYRWWNLHHDAVPSAAHPPAYPLYLAMWSLMGVDSMTGHRLAGALLGCVTIAALAFTVRRLGGERAGMIAALVAAVYPGLWINDTMLLSEVVAQAIVACFLYAMVRVWESPTWGRVIPAAVLAGMAVLSRNEQVVLVGVLAGWLLLARTGIGFRRRLALASVAGIVSLAVVAPWVVRNLVTFDRTVILTDTTGAVLSAASCDETYYGPKLGYYHDCFQGPWARKVLDSRGYPVEVDAAGRRLDESDRDVEPMRQASAYIRSHLGRLPVVVAARVGRSWGWFRPLQTTRFEIDIESRGAWQSWVGLGAMYALEASGVIGLVIMRRRRLPISPTLALVGAATFGAAISFGVARYRSTAEVGLIVPAAIALAAVWSGPGRARRAEPHDQAASKPIPASTTQTTSAPTR